MRRHRIAHHTTYTYDDDVTDSYGMVVARPRDLPGQRVLEHELWTEPGHADLHTHLDSEGNTATYFHVTEPHRRLVVSAVSVVESHVPELPVVERFAAIAWEDARPLRRRDLPEAAIAAQHAFASPLVDLGPEVAAYAAVSFPPRRPLVEAVVDLTHRVHEDFDYRPGSTGVATRVPDVLAARHGVCQDFAHLTIAGLRSLGLAARYVSGYLATDPPPGRERVVGADATHAWLEVWVPPEAAAAGAPGWLPVDPTNDCVTAERHVTVAWGRDYADVPPVKGVIFTEATESTMDVRVDVAPAQPRPPRT
ncbi:transglutaminase family protein [Nocardioides marmoribigeumensis]|uniref:Transglutaminase-like putative cysteine protease n=1 Tax=Nocardioides marmoribigeumensis TaxID=433649 RepID=A0ABU2BWV0_9ACTN|nr:transglutaminase family protein [Nocardioides marmoribigeumensis]MDR7362224.1 transglutaminase-like putative cysteine protease [Nocardioides marmoribigeumensis]